MIFLHRFRRAALAGALLAAAAAAPAQEAASAPGGAASAASSDDPYLWLESVDSPEAMKWVRAENEKTLGVLEKDARFPTLQSQALAIAQSHDRIPYPSQTGGRILNFWQDADHVHGLWRAASQKDYDVAGNPAWTTVLDLDKLSAADKASWVWKGANCEPVREQRCLLQLSDGGEDAVTVREFDLKQGGFVQGGFTLPKSKQSVAWEGDDSVVVTREWTPGDITTSGYPYVVKRLHRGEPLDKAREIFRGAKTDVGGIEVFTLRDASGHRALVIQREVTTFGNEKYLVTPAGVKKLAMPDKSQLNELFDGQLLIRLSEDWKTDKATMPAGALVAVDLAQATAHPDALEPVLIFAPGPRQSVENTAATRAGLLVATLDNVRGRVAVYNHAKNGTWSASPLELPDNASVGIVDADPHSAVAYLSVTGFLQPTSLWRVDLSATQARPAQVRALPAQFDASRDEVEQYEATSSDGTRIPYFIVHPKDMKLDGTNPTILYAYGGFEVSVTPSYSGITGKLWLERGGVWVVANIRGGGEFGPAWHEAGLKTKRQIIYDDFAAVGRDLVARKITSQPHLGIMGGSNGGLLMGVEMTEHPELWNAVDIQVPLLDMLRYEQIAAGTSWTGEYGSVSVPAERDFLAKISPYNQLRRGVKYPRALVWTTTKDDRVGPQHARKFAARLSEYGIPYYYYEVIEGGHAAGANLKERAHTSALEFTYFSRELMDQ